MCNLGKEKVEAKRAREETSTFMVDPSYLSLPLSHVALSLSSLFLGYSLSSQCLPHGQLGVGDNPRGKHRKKRLINLI